VYNKTVPDDDFIKSKHVVRETQVFLLVVLTDKIKSIKQTTNQGLTHRMCIINLFLITMLGTVLRSIQLKLFSGVGVKAAEA
jgi:hypothetical protein